MKQIFGVPGEENLAIVEALRRSRIKLVLTRHEQAAASMAATVGRLSGHAGVCLSTLGPGALNLTTGAASAKLGAMPMVMITGQKAFSAASRHSSNWSTSSRRHPRPGIEHTDFCLAFNEVYPFIGIGMPVQFAQAAGAQGDERRGHGLRDVEGAAVRSALCRRASPARVDPSEKR